MGDRRERQEEFWRRHPGAEALLIGALGALLLVVGIGGWTIDRDLSARGVRTTAVVLADVGVRDTIYEVRFTVEGGRETTAETSFALGGAEVGDVIDVEYDPQDPSSVAQVGARDGAWLLWGVPAVGGPALLVTAPLRYRRQRRRRSG